MAMGAAGCSPGEVPMLVEPAEDPSPKGCELMEAAWPAASISLRGMGIPLFATAACSMRI